MKIRRRTADSGPHARFVFIFEAIECGKVIAKDMTRYGLNAKLKAMGNLVPSAAAAAKRTG